MTKETRKYKNNEVKVTVDNKSGMLQFWIPSKYAQQYFGKKQKPFSFGAKATEENWTLAERTRLDIQADLQQGTFDPQDLAKYKHPSKRRDYASSIKAKAKEWKLYDLWRKFAKSKKNKVAETTYSVYYAEGCTIDKNFKNLKAQSFSTAPQQSEISDELAEKVKGKSQLVKLYQTLSSLINWAVKEELLPKEHPNRFGEYRKEQVAFNRRNNLGKLEAPAKFENVGEHNREKIAFTWEEAQEIIKAYHNRYNRSGKGLDHLAYMVEFLFLTGMRHGEARGLSWKDVSKDWSKLTIAKSYSINYNGSYVLKSTKNGKVRDLPLNPRAQEILKKLWEEKEHNPDDPIFQKDGKRFIFSPLYYSWAGKNSYKSIILPLIKQGKVSQYIRPYATRKTFITRQLQNGIDPKTLAYWVGDEVETIMEFYSDVNREVVPV